MHSAYMARSRQKRVLNNLDDLGSDRRAFDDERPILPLVLVTFPNGVLHYSPQADRYVPNQTNRSDFDWVRKPP